MKKSRTFFRPYSIQAILAVILIVLILPLNLLHIFAARRSAQALTNRARFNTERLLDLAAAETGIRLTRADIFLQGLFDSNVHLAAMQTAEDLASYNAEKFFLAQDLIDSSAQGSGGDIYFVYSPVYDDTLVGKAVRLQNSAPYADVYAFADDYLSGSPNPSPWHLTEMAGRPYLFTCHKTKNLYVGCLVDLSFIRDLMPKQIDYPSAALNFAGTPDETETVRKITVNSAGIDACKDFYLVCTIDTEDILSDLSWLQRNTYQIAVGYLLLIPILIALLTHLLIRPLGILLDAVAHINEGDQDYRIGKERVAREYSQVYEAFNGMLDRIRTLRIDNYEKELARQKVELEKNQLELQNVQLMIRPHFLQNTLGLIYTMSQMGESKKLGTFILYLSDYFRYVYRSGNEIPFSVELGLIRGYLALAEAQHPDSFECIYDIPDKIEGIMVPPLLIHNFIENAISHGARQGDYLTIRLSLAAKDGKAVFTVADNGIGIPEGDVETLNKGLPITDKERVHIGVNNSYRRLKSLYGEKASLHVDSRLFEGTKITVTIPAEVSSDSGLTGKETA